MTQELNTPIWEQLENESDLEFSWFVAYRNLGPGRSLDKAYIIATGGNKGQQAPGSWGRTSSLNFWTKRATRYDIDMLQEKGQLVITKFYEGLENMARMLVEEMVAGRFKPGSFKEWLEAMQLLGSYVNPEAVVQWRKFADEQANNPELSESHNGPIQPDI